MAVWFQQVFIDILVDAQHFCWFYAARTTSQNVASHTKKKLKKREDGLGFCSLYLSLCVLPADQTSCGCLKKGQTSAARFLRVPLRHWLCREDQLLYFMEQCGTVEIGARLLFSMLLKSAILCDLYLFKDIICAIETPCDANLFLPFVLIHFFYSRCYF